MIYGSCCISYACLLITVKLGVCICVEGDKCVLGLQVVLKMLQFQETHPKLYELIQSYLCFFINSLLDDLHHQIWLIRKIC